MTNIELNVSQFHTRALRLKSLTTHPFLVMIGKTSDVETFAPNSALFLYLLGFEFPETCIVISDHEIVFITSPKKGAILNQLSTPKFKTSIRIISKTDEPSIASFFSKVPIISLVDQQNVKGKFCDSILVRTTVNDVTRIVYDSFILKHDDEIENSRLCSIACSFISNKVVNIIEKSFINIYSLKNVVSKIEEVIDSKISSEIKETNLDFVYPPLIVPANVNNSIDDIFSVPYHLNYRIGLRYFGYCSEIGRTLLVNCSKEEKRIYELLFLMRNNVLDILKKNIYSFDQSKVEKEIASIEPSFELSLPCIYSIGIIQKESDCICIKNMDRVVLVIDLKASYNKMMFTLVDTVLIRKGKVSLLTEKNELDDFCIETEVKACIDSEARQKKKKKEIEKIMQRNEHQKALMDSLIEEMIEHYTKKEKIPIEDVNKASNKNEFGICPYLKENQLPRHKNIFVDQKRFCILVPFKNFVIPLPISIIKNASKTDDGILRINLNLTGNHDLIKSISYKSNSDTINEIHRKIMDTKKEYNLRKERGFEDDLNSEEGSQAKKEELIITTGRKIVLPDVFLRADIKGRKTKSANLELHSNGLKFVNEAATVELLFSNIKHMFFQEGDIDNRTILHFNLHKPLFAPKKTMNIQFFKDIGTNNAQDTSKSRNNEYMEAIIEKEEENKRKECNREFNLFVNKIEEISVLRVEIPTKCGSFCGVPFKSVVDIRPTLECLVNLTESPFFILPLNSVEAVCFERVVYGIKTCDMVFIFKDKTKPVAAVLSVEITNINKLKDFLDNKGIYFMESRVNIQWNPLIKDLMKDPVAFYENGAWGELQAEKDEEVSEEDESSENDLSESSGSDDDSFRTDDSTVEEEDHPVSTESTETEEEEESIEESDEESEDKLRSKKIKRK